MSDQKDVVEIMARAVTTLHYASRFNKDFSDPLVQSNVDANWHLRRVELIFALQTAEDEGYTITRGSKGVRHRQEPFESK
jgi:hypothetical protein